MRQPSKADILATETRCIYCDAPHATVEHMPPISMFRGRNRPYGMMFAGCATCNNGTGAADLVASFIARLSARYDQAGWKIAEAKARAGMLEVQAPGFLGEFFDPRRRRIEWLRTPGGIRRPMIVMDLSGPLTRAYLSVFSAKLAMALYRHHCGQALPLDGFVMCGAYTGDMTRRAVICSLDAEMDRPELRDFSFNPIDRVMADRGAYVAAALTVIRAYQVAGSPTVCGSLGSYEDWSAMVRSPLAWLGHADPVVSMETAREEDPELSAIRELFEHWREHLSLSNGYTTNAIIKAACEKGPGSSFDYNVQEFRAPEFRDLLLRQAGDGGAVNSRRLGKWLSRIKGRVVEGYRIEMKEDGSHGNRFSLCRIGTADDFPGGRAAPDYRGRSEPVF